MSAPLYLVDPPSGPILDEPSESLRAIIAEITSEEIAIVKWAQIVQAVRMAGLTLTGVAYLQQIRGALWEHAVSQEWLKLAELLAPEEVM